MEQNDKIQEPDQKKGFSFSERTKRKLRFGTNSIVLLIAVLAVVILLNVVLEQLPLSLDFTEEKLYTISETSKNALKNVNKKVEIIALYDRTTAEASPGSEKAQVVKLLDEYAQIKNISVSYVDMTKDPAKLRELVGEYSAGDYSAGDYIVKSEGRFKRISSSEMFKTEAVNLLYYQTVGFQGEKRLTAAILYVLEENFPIIYFSTGFGETTTGFTTLKTNLEDNGYKIAELNLSTEETIPDDAAIIVFLNPTKDLSGKALSSLENWFKKGGANAMFFMESLLSGEKFTNFNKAFEMFGLAVENDLVKAADPKQEYVKGTYTLLEAPISLIGPFSGVTKASKVYFFNSRSIRTLNTTGSYTIYELGSLDNTIRTYINDEGKEATASGKSTVVAASEFSATANQKLSRILISGSGLNLLDTYIATYNVSGGGMFLHTTKWMYASTLSNTELTDSIEIKTYSTSQVVVTSKSRQNQLGVFAIGVFPALILLGGFVVWIRRRHL